MSVEKENLLTDKIEEGQPPAKEEVEEAFNWMQEQLKKQLEEDGPKYSTYDPVAHYIVLT